MDIKRERNSEYERNDANDVGVAFAAVHTKANEKMKSDDEKLSLFWRVFGGTILSIAALIAITVYNNIAGSISELRAEISRINEARGELIKKDEFNTRIATVYDRTQNLQTQNNNQNGSLTALQASVSEFKDRLAGMKSESETGRKEILTAAETSKKEFGTALDAVRKDQTAINDGLKKEIATIELIRDRLTAIDIVRKDLDSARKDLASLELLRDKLTMVTTELKDHRDDIGKLRQDVERNQASDAERKKSRDEQYAKLLEAMKELDKATRSCSEKVARLEGTMTPTQPMPVKPMTKTNEKTSKEDE